MEIFKVRKLFRKSFKLCETFECENIFRNYLEMSYVFFFYYISLWAICVVLPSCCDICNYSVIIQLDVTVFVTLVSWHPIFVMVMSSWQLNLCKKYYVFVTTRSLWGEPCLCNSSIFLKSTMSSWQLHLREEYNVFVTAPSLWGVLRLYDNHCIFVTSCHMALGMCVYAFKKVLKIVMAQWCIV